MKSCLSLSFSLSRLENLLWKFSLAFFTACSWWNFNFISFADNNSTILRDQHKFQYFFLSFFGWNISSENSPWINNYLRNTQNKWKLLIKQSEKLERENSPQSGNLFVWKKRVKHRKLLSQQQKQEREEKGKRKSHKRLVENYQNIFIVLVSIFPHFLLLWGI